MNYEDPRIAAYLAGELADDQQIAFERELAGDPELRAYVAELRTLEEALRADVPDLDEARAAVAHLTLPEERGTRRSGRLGYAAAIVLAFAVGFWSRGLTQAERAEVPGPAPVVVQETSPGDGVDFERFASAYVRVGRERPGMSSLGRGLLALTAK